jgi:DNA-binding CsgD family transcriptional regulator
VNGDGGLLEQNVKLLMLRERELLSLRRKHHRFEAWLSLAQRLAETVESESDRSRVLRRVSEAFKSKLAFQRVVFFESVGTSLVPIRLDGDAEWLTDPLDHSAVRAVFAAKDGANRESDVAIQSATRLHRFLWHWVDAVQPPMLLVAGYDHERAEFYAPFGAADVAQFAVVGRELDLVLGNLAGIRRPDSRTVDAPPASARRPQGDEEASTVLTGRELEVSRLLARGKTNKEIGALLGISSRTVQTHVANIFEKLGVRNRAGAATWLVAHRLAV